MSAKLRKLVFALPVAALSLAGPGFAAQTASPALPLPLPPFPCYDPAACLQLANNGSGQAIVASAKKASGITGVTSKSLAFDPGNSIGIGGIVGLDQSPNPNGQSNSYSAGVFGRSANGEGALTVSGNWNGAVGVTFNNGFTTGNFTNGVVGLDRSTDNSGFNNGILGISPAGYGGEFITFNPSLTTGFSGIGVAAYDFSSDGGLQNLAFLGVSNGTGVYAVSAAPAQPPGSPQYPAVYAECAGGGPAIVAASGNTPADAIMTVDCAGNMTLSGTLTTNGAAASATKTTGGTVVASFPARQAQPTIEDVGQARLSNGAATVQIEPVFASTMDQHSAYVVLLTPEGDSKGLYVAEKSATGFAVRENQGGRSNLTFSYRIVAKPYDTAALRLPSAGSLHAQALKRSAATTAKLIQAAESRGRRAAAPYLVPTR